MAQYINGADLTNWDGWINLPLTPVYGSATTFTYPADLTGILSPGDKIRVTNNGSVKYFYVLPPVTYSSPNTTITVTGGSDYSLVNAGSPVMSTLSYSKMATPIGFPQWFNWSPSIVGFSANPANAIYRFKIEGRTTTLNVQQSNGLGTSNATSFTLTLPVTASGLTNYLQKGPITSYNNSALSTSMDYYYIGSSSTTVAFAHGDNISGWTASGTKGVSAVVVYEF